MAEDAALISAALLQLFGKESSLLPAVVRTRLTRGWKRVTLDPDGHPAGFPRLSVKGEGVERKLDMESVCGPPRAGTICGCGTCEAVDSASKAGADGARVRLGLSGRLQRPEVCACEAVNSRTQF